MSENIINQITLDCLLNKELYQKHVKSSMYKNIDKKDKKFYRKRVYNLTKELLLTNDKEMNSTLFPDVKYAFDNYVKACIHYFKIVDNNDILQEDYKEYQKIDQILHINGGEEILVDNSATKEDADKLMMRSINIKNHSLDKFVKVKNLKKENMILPKQKEVNLKDPILKNKGIKKKKNIPINYEENKNPDTEKKEYNLQEKKQKQIQKQKDCENEEINVQSKG
jgi:hypothetical protein